MSGDKRYTPRGFEVYAEVETDYGHVVRVQESSAAGQPSVWMFVLDSVDVPGSHSPHLTRDQARQVRDALTAFLDATE